MNANHSLQPPVTTFGNSPVLLPRRDALRRMSAGTLLALGLWPGALRAAEAGGGGRFRFIALNDTHAVSKECGDYLTGLVTQLKKEDADLVLLGGDVADKGEAAYLELAKEVFSGLRRTTYPVIGNHDYLTATDRAPYEKTFPNRLNYHFEHQGWQFVGLDTSDGQRYENTAIQPATFSWLDDNLKRLTPRRPTVLFTHFPLGADVKYRPTNADALLKRFLKFNLQAVFCGHYHGFTERTVGQTIITTNRCCALTRGNHDKSKEKGYFVCAAADGRLTRRFVEYK